MKLNEEQIERAKTVNLPSFLMANGFELKKVGREYVWKEHDSLHIKDNGPGERGQWFRFSENKGGDNIAFLREYMGMSFVDAVEALTGEHIDRSYTASHTYTPHHVQQTARELSLAEADNARRVFAYLCKTRGLDYDMVSALVQSGVISQEEKTGNVLFKYFDEHGKMIGAEKVGTSTEHKFKGVATGSAGGHGFEVCRGDGCNLLFFESSIDMLSYLQMFSPDNCRLVSMMGVKPNIVLDTMERYGIAPQNVYLCSDNDEAGNDFANRLISEYPDMKRIATPDKYKDWNDMLKDIPKTAEQEFVKKEADSVAIQTYGNKTWNDATDNRDKSLVTISVQDFPKLQEKLELAGINYFGYVRENSVIMAVGDKDMEWFKQIAGTPDLMPTKSNRPYSPPEKNIFGTAEYRYIPQKEYLTADRDLVLKMAEIMAKRGMQFSGRVYPSGKGTLTVSHADLFAVRNIRDEVVNMRKQFASPDKAQEVGSRDYRANRDTHYYMSKLTPEQFSEVKPFLETGVGYHAVSRDGKVAFALDKENAPAFHRALENAVREVGLIHTMQELALSEDKMTALAPVMHRLAVENMQIDLADFFDQRYDDSQFGEMLSLVNAYINQPVAERYGEHSMLNDMLEAKSSFDRAIELSDFFSQHDFSDEQRAAITAMFVGDVTRGQLDSIDETFTAEDIQAYDEILHNALQESDVADFLTAHRQAVIERENADKEPTEEEVLFGRADLARFIAQGTLSSDEWEDMAFPLFEDGYLEKHKANDKAAYGYHLSEPAFFELAHRYHEGEDIRKELAVSLMEHKKSDDMEFVFEDGKISDRTFYYAENLRHTLHAEYGDDSVICSFAGMQREVTYAEIGQAFLDRIEEEYKDILYLSAIAEMEDVLPDVSEDTLSDLITAFDGAVMHGWQDNEVIQRKIKKALYEILGDEDSTEKAFAAIADMKYNFKVEQKIEESSIHFGLLGNGVTVYDVSRTDPETNDYVTVAHISPEGVVRVYDDSISADDMAKISDEARSVREKFMADWDSLDTTTQYARLYNRADAETMLNIGRETISTEEKIAKYMPFVFFGEGERPQPEMAEKQRNPAVESIDFIGDRNGFEAVKNAAQNSSFGTIISDGDTLTIVVHNDASVDDVRYLVETAQDNGVYLNKPSAKLLESRFGADFMQETPKPTVADLSVGDVILYDGKRREVENISEKSIMLKDVDAPDFGGVLLGTSDVLAYDGWQDDMNAKGFEIISKSNSAPVNSVVADFRAKTAEMFKPMDYWTPVDIEGFVGGHVIDVLRENGVRFNEDSLRVVLNGSRARGIERADSDVDVVVEIDTDMREDALFNMIHAEPLMFPTQRFQNIPIDINPITPYETGTLETYLPKAEEYLTEEAEKIAAEKAMSPLDRAKNLINDFCAEEYSVEADFSDMSHVDIAYTTDADTELEIQVYADLEKFRMVTEYNGKTVREEQYDSLESMVDQALSNLDFNELAYLTDEERAVGEKADVEQSDIGENSTEKTFIDEITKAVETAHADDEQSHERFEVRKNGENFGIWDNIRDEFYTDDNGIVLTYANEKDAESGLAEVKKAVDEKESAEWLYAERSKQDADVSEDMDAPLFTDAEVISEIQKNENSSDNRPFWEQPTLEGEQLSLFGDSVPIEPKKSQKQKPEFATGPVVDGVQVYNALAAEIDRGTGFVDGKLRVQEFYDEQHPTTEELAKFLKKAYGIGGHSGEGNISLVSTDSKGMTFDFRNGEKFRHSWYNIATMTEARLRDNTYLSAEQQEKYAKMRAEKAAESTLTPVELKSDESNIVTVGDKFRDRKTGEISEIISFSGALPWYEDQCTVQRESHGFIITENMSVDKLFDDKLYEYFGKGEVPEKSEVSEKTAEQVAPEQKAPVTADAKQAAELPKPKNLSQLKNALQVGMEFEILDHHKRDRIGERRVVTGKNTANFTSKRLDENNQPYGDDIYMDWEKAGNWQFGSDKITVFMDTDKQNILLSFRFIDSKEHEKSEPEKTAEVIAPETKEPVPVYTGEWKVSENTELYKQILAENLRFKEMAREVIGNGKNPADSVKALVDEFGMERTAFLTALNIVSHPMDGRFYPADKEWACKVLAPYLDVKPDEIIHRDPEKEHLFTLMIGGGQLFAIHNTHLAQFAEALIPEYEKYLELSHTAEKSEPELSVGDFIEYKGKEYKVENLDPDGFITLNDPMLDGKVQDRVTFITEEFLNNAEFKLIEPKTEDVPDKGDSFTITDDSLGSGGAKEKFRNNIAAIKMLKMLEKEHLPAYPRAKEVLSKYVGWGGLASAFDKNASSWAAEYAELKELLTPQEYRQAQASTLDAFYTSPTIINSIYEALDNFGFKSGNVLEPSMGIGNFFGCMSERMRVDSNLYGIELDSISGRIAQMLYPYADIAIKGFEHNTFQNGCFDVAVGNVPFGDLGFTDNKHFTSKLHDYFFMEALDKVKNGGIIAFVTSSGTLDKKDESVRQMLADKADLIGAIRLPGGKNGAFKGNAGTEVTTDIIFLQKHEGKTVAEMSDIPDWVHIGETADGLPINQYFVNHPDMILGDVVKNTNPRGGETMVVAEDNFDLKSALHDAVSKLHAEIDHDLPRDVYAKTAEGKVVEIPSNLRNYSFFMSDDQVFFKKNNAACEFRYDKSTSQHKRFKAFIELRDLTRELIEAMEFNKSDSVIGDLQAKLNTAYDDFYKKFGLIHSQTNKRYFSEDVSYNLVAGLEKDYDKNKLLEKSDIFTKRTIVPPQAVDHVDTALEALTLSVAEKAKVDFEYMSDLTGMTEDELKQELQGEIFKVPHTENEYQTASEYLSGDIRVKLKTAEEIAEYDADFNVNVNALRAAMPEPLKAGDIDVKIGATWLDPKYYEQFMYELLQTPDYQRSDGPTARWNRSSIIGVEYSEAANSFHVSNKSSDRSVLATQKFGSHKMNAYDIFEHILNLQEPKVYKSIEVPDPDHYGETKEKRVVDVDATRVVQRKADDIRKAFKAWIFKDPQRREAIVQKYNELFNSIRPREFDGSALSFPLMNADIHLHDHQKNAIAHAMFGGNTLFAHCVGAGKTFEMIATAMESKRLGLCTKSLFAVPNHLTEQIGDDFQKLYPGANILVATKKDFKKENRQQLFAKIATGNYDAVIIGHSQLGKIPVSKERQVVTIQSQIDDILRSIEELKKQEGSKFQIKAMERTRKSLQKQLDKLEKTNQDDTLTFEQLGIDRLFIDEAHEFKNLFVSTKLQNVAGISNSASQKALDLFLKCRYLDEKTDGRGVIFATGTPNATP